jgi:hypothetical protein
LIAVDRSRNESVAQTVTITPLTPDIVTIGNSLDVWDDFGGMSATWQNANKAEIAVNLLVKNQNNEYMPLSTFYSSSQSGKGSARGFEAEVPIEVASYVEDRWGNQSETKYFTISPIFETEFDKSKFNGLELPTDGPLLGGYPIARIWDGNTTNDGGIFGSTPGTGRWPQWITIDLGVVGTISRIVLWQRVSAMEYIWYEGNLRRFEIWGQETLDPSGSWDTWTLLQSCESIKPSGLPVGQMTDEDEFVARNGEEFIIYESTNPDVRYIRIKVLQTWASGGNFQIQEMKFFGQPAGLQQ